MAAVAKLSAAASERGGSEASAAPDAAAVSASRTPLDAMRDLRVVMNVLLEDGRPECLRVASAIGQYDIGTGDPSCPLGLEKALDLAPSPGGEGWRTLERRAQRDDLLRTIAAEHFSEGSMRQRCAAIAKALLRRAVSKCEAATSLEERLDEVLACCSLPSQTTIQRAIASASES
jgi:hypothetical protein